MTDRLTALARLLRRKQAAAKQAPRPKDKMRQPGKNKGAS